MMILGTLGCRTPATTARLAILGDENKYEHKQHIELDGAINETLSFRFSVRCGANRVAGPRLSVAPFESLKGRLDSSAVRLYRMLPVRVDHWPGWHIRAIPPSERVGTPLDVLVPLRAPKGGLPDVLSPDKVYYFWADLAIPKGTLPGIYSAELHLESSSAIIDRVPLRLMVRPFVLPDEVEVDVLAELDHRTLIAHHIRSGEHPYNLTMDAWRAGPAGEEVDALVKSVMRMLRAHGVTPVLHRLAPIVQVTAQNSVSMDWVHYDSLVGDCLSGTMFFDQLPARHWPLPLGPIESFAYGNGSSSVRAQPNWIRSYLDSSARHFQEKGWVDRVYLELPEAAHPKPAWSALVQTLVSFAHNQVPAIPVLSAHYPQDLGPYGWVGFRPHEFSDAVDVWMPAGQFYDPDVMAGERTSGRQTWMSVDRPPFSGSIVIQARPTDTRVLAWQAASLEAAVIHLGCINHWPDAVSNPGPTDCLQYDPSTLIYPGTPFGLDEPVETVRLKYLRLGLQDAAWAKVLHDRGLDYVVTALRESLVPYAGASAYRTHFLDGRPISWPGRMKSFATARQIMIDELVRHSAGSESEGREASVRRTAAWRRLTADTREPQLFVEGVRVSDNVTADGPGFTVAFILTVVNRTRASLAGVVRFAGLPEGWSQGEETRMLHPIPRGGRGRIRLVARAAGLPVARGSPLDIPIEFEAEDGRIYRVHARVACATVITVVRPIRIDGDLSDWPPGSTNTVADFRLISGSGTGGAGPESARPSRRTLGFFAKDRDYLYVAINAEVDGLPKVPMSNRNQVDYEDMVPVGEELIEILIDPTNSGSRSPTDLYRIVVKRGGGHLCEKGIRTEPPCAERHPWPVDLEVASKVSSGRWTVELKMPLATFGVSAEQAIWGMNVVRFDVENQEFSTWSGASLNAYDPLSLGNLYLP